MSRIALFLITLLLASSPCLANPFSMVTSIEQRIVGFVHKTVDSLRYSKYKMGGSRFDTSSGIYVLDCSSYVDQILQNTTPNAYSSLVSSSGSDTPTTRHYYDFFSNLSHDDPYWNKINDVEELRPGDIIVFRYKKSRRSATRGHVMVVMDKPTRDSDAYLVRVTDSAPIPHSEDTRARKKSGIGIGTLLLKTNPETGKPAAYAWREGSCWKKNVHFAMARPTDAV